ncbi:MAG: hypothetical protein RR379_12250, partial [Clostridia bacterium]
YENRIWVAHLQCRFLCEFGMLKAVPYSVAAERPRKVAHPYKHHFVLNAALYPERRVLSRMLRFIPNAALCPNAAFYPECCVLSRMLRFVANVVLYPECGVSSRMSCSIPNAALYPECRTLSRMPRSL